MVIVAHPDDESFGVAGTLARYAGRGVVTCVVSATRGEAGELKGMALEPGQSLADLREEELRCACQRLGVQHLRFLGYRDGTLDQVDEEEAVGRLVRVIRELRPDVLITFGPEGIYGHPDHVAVHRWATAAFHDAADPERYPQHLVEGLQTHAPRKLFYHVLPQERVLAMGGWTRPRQIQLNGQVLPFVGYLEDQISTRVDVGPWLDLKFQAILCHRSQVGPDAPYAQPDDGLRRAMATECFILAYSRVPPHPDDGSDLLAGL